MKQKLFAVALIAALPHVTLAGGSAELRVTGRIVPDACVTSFSSGGVADYGQISTSAMQAGNATVLSRKQITLSVACAIPTNVAIKLVDNKSSAVVPGLVRTSYGSVQGRNDQYNFGISNDQGRQIGGYIISFDNQAATASKASGVSNAAPTLEMNDARSGSSWRVTNDRAVRKDAFYTWAASGTAPMKIRNVQTSLSIQAIVDKPENLPLKDEVPLSGSATFELMYL
jgi:hypothetical protein